MRLQDIKRVILDSDNRLYVLCGSDGNGTVSIKYPPQKTVCTLFRIYKYFGCYYSDRVKWVKLNYVAKRRIALIT